jgi:hypothetical protein
MTDQPVAKPIDEKKDVKKTPDPVAAEPDVEAGQVTRLPFPPAEPAPPRKEGVVCNPDFI